MYQMHSLTGATHQQELDGILGACQSIDQYTKLCRVGEGTYGVVYKAQHKQSKQIVALKKIRLVDDKTDNDNVLPQDGLPIAHFREIQLMKSMSHQNIVRVLGTAVGAHLSQIYTVMDYCPHDLAQLIDSPPLKANGFTAAEIKSLMYQLMKAVEFLHRNFIMHRDLKLSNVLLSADGTVKLADFGLARKFGQEPDLARNSVPGERVGSGQPSTGGKSSRPSTSRSQRSTTTNDEMQDVVMEAISRQSITTVASSQPVVSATTRKRPLTPKVVTLWYRAPEILYGATEYLASVDVWSCGCIFAELLGNVPLLPGRTEVEELFMIRQVLGSVDVRLWPELQQLPLYNKIDAEVDQMAMRCTGSRVTHIAPPQPAYAYLKLKLQPPTGRAQFTTLTPATLQLLESMLMYNPRSRTTLKHALEHQYFQELPRRVDKQHMRTFPSTHPSGAAPSTTTGDVMYGAGGVQVKRQKTKSYDSGNKTPPPVPESTAEL